MNFRGLAVIELGDDIIYAELAHIMNKGLMYGKRKLELSEDFYFYYPSAELKGQIQLGNNKDANRFDSLSGGIFPSED